MVTAKTAGVDQGLEHGQLRVEQIHIIGNASRRGPLQNSQLNGNA
jgi:hypothetical protein